MINGCFKQGKTPGDAITWLNKQGTEYGNELQSEISRRMRELSNQLQEKLNTNIAGGPVSFTGRALFFNYIERGDGTRIYQIIVRGDQAAYLRDVVTDSSALIDKIIPTSSAKLSKQGNISGLKAGINNKKYAVVQEKGKKYLIDTTKKKNKRDKRVIGVKESKRRKMVFDFFKEAEDGAMIILSDVKGQFKITKRIE